MVKCFGLSSFDYDLFILKLVGFVIGKVQRVLMVPKKTRKMMKPSTKVGSLLDPPIVGYFI